MTVRASAQPRRNTRTRLRGETSRRVIATLISTGMVLQPIAASAGPTNGTVVGGNATISTAGNTTTIEQIDARVVIDWDSFDIDSAETVRFQQPTTQAVALNRVLGDLPTNIRGQLLANGHVWIVNRHGVTFHAGSIVNVGGLLATTADIANTDFLAGRNNFTIPGEDGATVINNGSITFGAAGLAGLVAPGAENHGQIAGKLGSVIVAGEKTFAIDFAGDGMFAFEPKGAADFKGRAVNTGSITNGGGYILIAARTASSLVDESISLGGVVAATTAEMKDGRIVLSGGGGLVNIAGTLDASGGAGQKGGSVKVSGGRIDVKRTARVDVSGGAGGGKAEIGGGYQGASMGVGLRNAQDTLVQEGASLRADAGEAGDGGTVVVWAEGRTGYAGAISATGGTQSGDGGTVEVSGKQTLGFAGTVDATAQNGETGTLLLDPLNIFVADTGDAMGGGSIGFSDNPGAATIIDGDHISNAGAAVTLQATNDIEVNEAITPTDTLQLQAGNDITVNQTITSMGFVQLDAGNNVNVNADVSTTAATGLRLSADSNLVPGAARSDGTGTVSVTGTAMVSADSILISGADVSINGAASVDAGATGTVLLSNTSGDVVTLGANGTAFTVDSTELTTITAGSVQVVSQNEDIRLDAVTTLEEDLILSAGTGNVTYSGASTNLGNLNVASAGSFAPEATPLPSLSLAAGRGASITVTDGGVALESIVAGTTTVNAAGAGSVTVNGVTAGTVAIDSGTGAVTFETVASTLSSLLVSASQSIGQDIEISVTGTTQLNAVADVTLDNALNDFTGTVSASGVNIELTDTNALRLGDIDASALTVIAGGAITQELVNGDAIDVTGTSSFTTPTAGPNGFITLDETLNEFGGAVSADGVAVSLADADAIELGRIVANSGGADSDLTVSAAGAITQTAEGVVVVGETTLAAGGNPITLQTATNDFFSAVSATGTDVKLTDANALILGDIDVSDLTLDAGGAIWQTAAAMVNGVLTATTSGDAITLNNAANMIGTVAADTTEPATMGGLASPAADVEIRNAAALALGNIVAQNLTVNVTDAVTPTNGIISQTAGTTVNAAGLSTLNATGAVLLANTMNNLTTLTGTAESFTVNEVDGLDVTGLTATVGNIDLTSTGNVLVSGATMSPAAINVTAPDVSVTAALIAGTTATFTNSGGDPTVVGIADADVDADPSSFDLTDGDIANIMFAEIAVNSLGGNIDVQGVSTAANQSLGLDGGNGAAMFGTLSFSVAPTVLGANGALTATNVGAVSQVMAAPITVSGVTSITTGGSGAAITLDQANTFTGSVSARGTNIVLDSAALMLDDIVATGTFEADAVGALSQTATGIDVAGTTTLEGSSIVLGSGNDFDSDDTGDTVIATATGGVLTLNDADALVLGDVSATDIVTVTAATTLTAENRVSTTAGAINLTATAGAVSLGDVDAPENLTVNAGTSISQVANDDNVTVAGVTSLTAGLVTPAAGSIILSEDNNFDSDATGDAVSARGTNITLKDLGSINLDDVDATGNLSITAARDVASATDASISQTVTGSVLVTGTTALKTSAGGVGPDSITLNNATNDFDRGNSGDALTAMTDAGTVMVRDANTLRIGVSTSGDTFTAIAEDSLLVTGMLSSTGGGVNLTANNDAMGADVLVVGTGVSISAPMGPTVLTASGMSDILVGGGSSVTGNGLTLDPGGTLRDNPASVGTVTLTSTGGGNFVLPKTNLTALDLIINADGTITQSADAIVNGVLTANTMGDEVLLTNASNQISTVAVDTTIGMAAAANVSVTTGTAVTLGTVRAANLTVNVTGAGSGLSQTMGTTVDATGTSTLNAVGSVMLANTGNRLMTLTGMAASFQINEADGVNTDNLTATAGSIDIDSGGSILANAGSLMQATGMIDLTSTGAGASVGALGNGQIDAEGDLTLAATNGMVSTGAASRLEGMSVTLTAQSVATGGTVTATNGLVDVDATAGDALLGGTTTSTNGGIDIDATGQATLTGGSASTTLTVDSADVSLQPGPFTATGGATFTNNAGTTVTRLAADDANPSTFDLSTADLAQLSNTDVTVNAPGVMVVDTVNTGVAPNVTLNAASGSVLVTGAASVPGNLTINSPQIGQNGGTSLVVDGTVDLNATGQILLSEATNDFKDRVDASAGTIRLRDVNAITLGEIASLTGVNELTVTAGGTITDTDGQSITVAGLTRLDAGGNDILLDNNTPADAHDFSETSDFRASGGDINVEDKDGIQLGAITTAANGDPTIAANTGELTLKTGGAITQTAGASVAGETKVDATGFDVTLDQANDLVGNVDIAGRNIELNAAPTIRPSTTLGDIDASGTLTVTSNAIIDDNGDRAAGDDIDVAGTTSITAMFVRLDDASNDFIGSVSAIGDVGVFLRDLNDIVLGQISVMGASEINVDAGGSITDTAGQSVSSGPGGAATFTSASGDVVLDNTLHNLDIVDASGGTVVLTDVDAIQLRTITQTNATTALVVTAGGAISDVDAGAITVAGATLLTTPSDNITIDGPNGRFAGVVALDADGDNNGAHGDILFNNLQRLVLGEVDAQNATLTTFSADPSGIVAVAAQDIEGVATYQTNDGSIDLSNAGNDFTGVVNARTDQNGGGDERTVKITDVNSVILGDVDAGDLAVIAQGGSIADDGVSGVSESDVNADGTTTLTATAEIILDDARTNFDADAGVADAGTAVNANGTVVSLTDEDAIKLGVVNAAALMVKATGSITDTVGAAITVPGSTSLNANGFDIALDNADTHDFADATPATPNSFSAMGGDVTVDDLDSIQLGTVTTAVNADATIATNTGALKVATGGDVAQSGTITAPGDATIDAAGFDVALAQTNQMLGTINIAARDITLTNGNAGQTTTLGDIDATRNLSVISAGAIADNGNGANGDDINVAGTTTLAGSAVELNDASNDFIGVVDATGNTGVTLNDKTDITLGNVKSAAGSAVNVTAGGSITDTAGRIIDTGAASFTATNGVVTLDEDHEFRGVVDATALAGNVTLRDANALTLGTVKTQVLDAAATTALTFGNVMADTLTAVAGTDITDTMGQTVMATNATLTATAGQVELDEAHDFGSATATAQTNLTLNDANDLNLISATATTGKVDISTVGELTTAGLVSAGGAADLTSGTAMTLGSGIAAVDAVSVQAGTMLSVKGDVASSGGATSLATLNGNIAVDGGITISAKDTLTLTPTGGKLVDGTGVLDQTITLVSGGDFVLPATNLSVLDLVIMSDGTVTQVLPADVVNDVIVRTSGKDIVLDKANTFGTVLADTTKDGAGPAVVSLQDTGALTLDAIIASALTVKSDGLIDDVDNAPVTAIRVTGLTDLDAGAGAIKLDNPNHDFGGGVTAVATGDVELADLNDLTLSTVTTAAGLVVSAGQDLVLTDPVSIMDALALSAGRNVRIEGGVNTNGNPLSLTAGANTANTDGGITVTPAGSLVAGDITMTADQGISLQNVTGTKLDVTKSASVTFAGGTTDIAGPLTIRSDGDVTDDPSSTLKVTGTSKIEAPGSVIALDSSTNDFGGAVEATGGSIALRDANGLTLAKVLADAGIDVDAGGALAVTQDVTSTAGPVTLDAGSSIDVASGVTVKSGGTLMATATGGNATVSSGATLEGTAVSVKAGQTVTLANTTANTLDLDGVNVSFGDGNTDVAGTMSIMASGMVTDTGGAALSIGGETSILASGAQVVLDSANNDFMSTVYAVADSLALKDKTDLTIVDSDIENVLNADADGALIVQDLTAGATTLVADGPTTAARFSVASLDVTSGNTITVMQGAATGPVTLAKGAGAGVISANVTTLATPSLTITDLGAVTLDRVGSADAVVNVTAEDITLGVLRAKTSTLSAKAGDIETAASLAARTITVGRRGAKDLTVAAPDIAVTDRLVDVAETLTVDASRNVTLTGAANNGAPVKNALRTVSISPTGVGRALTLESSETLDVNRVGAATVGSADVTGDKDVTVDVDAVGDATVTSNGTATETATLTGKVGGNAIAKSDAGNAVIDGTVAGNADATAGQNASIKSSVGGNATAKAAAGNALIEDSVTGNAKAEAGGDATIAGTIGGAADATSGKNASIGSMVGGSATATAVEAASISGSVGQNASATGGTATINADVGRNASATADTDATIAGSVGENATIDAGRNAALSGTVDEDAMVDAGAAITLGATDALVVKGALDADSGTNMAAGGSITDVSSVVVAGTTVLDANTASDIELDNAANDFSTVGGVQVSNARNVKLIDASVLEIVDIDQATGNVELTALSGELKLRTLEATRPGNPTYEIAPNKKWALAANDGNVTIDGRIDGMEGMPETGDLTVKAGPNGTIRFKNLVGSRDRLRDVLISGGQNLIFGLRTDADFEIPTDLNDGDFLPDTVERRDIFFVKTLKIEGVTDNILLLVPSGTEFGFDFEDRYYGLSIEDSNGFEYTGADLIDLFGEIGGIRSRATGLSPLGPRSGSSEFNNCLIGDPNSCSALTQANVLRLVDLTPDNVFVLDPDQVEQLFLSFGNEELWGLPSVFSTDIEDDDDEEESSEGTQ